MKKIMMCPPDYFRVEYEINPWMKADTVINVESAYKSYNDLKETYYKLGVDVLEIKQDMLLPDMVYTANIGYAEGNKFIKSNLKFTQRKRESELAAEFLNGYGYDVHYIPEEIVFEGEGDVIRSQNKYFMGWGKRTHPEAKKYLEELFNKEFIGLELVSPYFYHLDTCFAPLNDEAVVINEESFSPESLEKIFGFFKKVITTNSTDNQVLACNLVVLGHTVIIGKGISSELRRKVEKEGYDVAEIDMTEYLKGGGSVKCVTFEIFEN